MKRVRDNGIHASSGSQFKRPCSSSRGSVGGGATTSQKLTTNDAFSYLKEVKDMFQDKREKYDMFLKLMKDFSTQRTDMDGVIARVKELFKGHNNLIFGFKTFLPKGYEITLDEDEAPPKKSVKKAQGFGLASDFSSNEDNDTLKNMYSQAFSFCEKVKEKLNTDDYQVFLRFLHIFNSVTIKRNDLQNFLTDLLGKHPDLMEELNDFMERCENYSKTS